jgi:UDP-GlcNAc3NAcA epimerase
MKRKSPAGERSLRLVSVVGARPQFVKAAVISRAAARHNAAAPNRPIDDIIVHTGQHYDEAMSGVFFDQLGIPSPRRHLGVGSAPHGRQTGSMLARLEPILKSLRPDVVLVHGDTNSTLAAALAAAKLGFSIAHVEAGLRSYNRAMPEEINRVLTDHLATWLFCPTETAVRNLKKEGLTRGVRLVGDVMFDAFLWNRRPALLRSRVLKAFAVRPKHFALATIHRQENTDDPVRLRDLMDALAAIAERVFPVVLPLHPRTRKALDRLRPRTAPSPALLISDPLSYHDMIALTAAAKVVLTDSGGLQKEAYFSGTPCLTLRNETEWTETVAGGRNFLTGADPDRIAAALEKALALKRTDSPRLYGNGDAGQRILNLLLQAGKGT